MHLHRTDPERLVGLLSLADADHLLTASGIRTPAVRMAKDGSVLPESAYTRHGATLAGKPLSGLVDARKALDLFAGGATVVFQGLQRYWPPLTRLVADLERELGHPCQANAYLTPPGSQGFAVHSDTHDVFVFQTHGTKQWEVRPDGMDGPTEQVLLEPGVSMYLPTGTPHAARAQGSASLHVTLGINQLTWRGLLRRTVEGLLADEPDDHLPAGYVDDPHRVTGLLAERLAALADRVRDVDAEAAVRREATRFLTTRPSRLGGGLLDVLEEVTDDTVVTRRSGSTVSVTEAPDGRVRLLLGDRVLDVPAHLRPVVDEVVALTGHGTLRVGDLTLDPQSRVVLSRRLVREGLLQVVR